VLSYLDVLLERKPVGKRVAVIGAGGIGFDVSEFLVHQGVATSLDRDAFWKEWGIDTHLQARGGVAGIKPSRMPRRARCSCCSARSQGRRRPGQDHRLDSPHRLKNKQVQMLNSVEYLKIDDAGLHIRIGDGEPQVLAVDNIVICAGQDRCASCRKAWSRRAECAPDRRRRRGGRAGRQARHQPGLAPGRRAKTRAGAVLDYRPFSCRCPSDGSFRLASPCPA
jgi:hypothetical protein